MGPVAAVLIAALIAGSGAPAHGGARAAQPVARPAIAVWPIPFGAKRKRETAAYSQRHYGQGTWRLRHPRVIVEHMAQAGSVTAVRNGFVPDVPDVELHELPNVCAHFVIGS
jgi:hypothetical protein